MGDPKRILAKLLGPGSDPAPYAATGEPLETLVELLRDVLKCRKTRQWILDAFGIDLAVSPQTFFKLLDLPRINFVETSNRDLEVKVISLKGTRQPDAPVSVGNLNSALRELYRVLFELSEKKRRDFPELLLEKEMTAEKLARTTEIVPALRSMNGKLTGYLLTGHHAGNLEKEFREMFPACKSLHPLRHGLDRVESELAFYKSCRDIENNWNSIGLDLFLILRKGELRNLLDNIREMGNLLWNIVYQHPAVEQCFALAGISFADTHTLFDETQVKVHSF